MRNNKKPYPKNRIKYFLLEKERRERSRIREIDDQEGKGQGDVDI